MKMGLESFLRTAEYADEQVRRYYTKLGAKLNLDHENRKFIVCEGLNIISLIAAINSFVIRAAYAGINHSPPSASDIAHLVYVYGGFLPPYFTDKMENIGSYSESSKEHERSQTTGEMAVDPALASFQNINHTIRLPLLIGGIGLIGKFGLDVANYFVHGAPIENGDYSSLLYGGSMLSLASSMYIRDSDKKLLQKKPFWKAAYDSIADKIRALIPEPTPLPQPVPAYSRLDTHLEVRPN